MTAAIATKSTRPRTKVTDTGIRLDERTALVDPEEERQSIRDEIVSDRRKVTTEWRKYLLDWLESPFHQDGDNPIHEIEMTIRPNGVVAIIVNLDDVGDVQVRITIDNGHDT